MIIEIRKPDTSFVRSRDGWIFGICEGVGRNNGWNPNMLRLIWLLSILAFGSGLLLYGFLALVLPREDKLKEYDEPKVLGVAYKLSHHYGWDLVLTRLALLGSFFLSFGMTFIVYLILWVMVPDNREKLYF